MCVQLFNDLKFLITKIRNTWDLILRINKSVKIRKIYQKKELY